MAVLLVIMALGAAASAVATAGVRIAARRLGFVAAPLPDRWHTRPTALMGGVGIMLGVIVAVTTAFQLLPHPHLARFAGIVAAAVIMFVSGILDDVWKFRPATKLMLQTLAAGVLVSSGTVYAISDFALVNVLFTIFWFLFLTNALNLLDNMDGVAAGVGAIAAVFLGISFSANGLPMLAGLCAALGGACIGFLPFNFKPASIFMGDSGSLLIGALLAGLGAALPRAGTGSVGAVLLVPALIVIIPILDTVLVTFTRTLAGRAVSIGGRDHTAHRLVALGMSERAVALMLYGFSILGGLAALGLTRTSTGYELWFGALFVVVLCWVAAYLARFHTYPAAEAKPITVLATNLLYKGRALELAQDIVVVALAYYGAFLLRWDGRPPTSQQAAFDETIAVVIVAHVCSFALAGVYRGAWHRASVADLRRVVEGVALAALMTSTLLVFGYRESEFSRSVLVMTEIIVVLLAVAARSSFRLVDDVRSEHRSSGVRALIYGAGGEGDLLLRELRGNPERQLAVVGFIDDDARKQGTRLQGVPIFAGGRRIGEALQACNARIVIVAARNLCSASRQELEVAARVRHVELMTAELCITPYESVRPAEADGIDYAMAQA